MRSIFILLAVVFSLGANAQQKGGFAVFYGLDLSEVYTGSGHGSGLVMNSSIQKGRNR